MQKSLSLVFLVFLGMFSSNSIATTSKKVDLEPFENYYQPLSPDKSYRATAVEVVARLGSGHYKEIVLNDEFSQHIYEKFFTDLDPMKMFFTEGDIGKFAEHNKKLDDYLRRGDTSVFFEVYNLYSFKVLQRYITIINSIDSGLKFDFTKQESLQINREDEGWVKSETELDDLWRKRLKNSYLSLKLAGKDDEKTSSLIRKRYFNNLNQISQINSNDVFEMAINSYAALFGPHTQYFSPRKSENFNIRMKLSLEGIGALLKKEDEYTEVVRLIPAGPADKSKRLKAGDKVIGVAQGEDGEMVDIVGWRLDDVVDLIRGEKKSVVRLNILTGNNENIDSAKEISITRGTVKLEEQAAQKKIIDITQNGQKLKIGVIELPTFYVDFAGYYAGDPNYKSTTRDVKKLISELKKENIDGLVIDLRENGGGALTEANSLTGLFIKSGPTVQVKDASAAVGKYNDPDPGIFYDGPLTVLVNRLSASASEIFAGAIQDYRRGIVVGVQTFGKGTVQQLAALGSGQLKYTQAKFYRVSGDSTQHQGVVPDISFPALYDVTKIGESSLDNAMPWDQISSAKYRRFNSFERYVPELIKRHNQRMLDNPDLVHLTEQLELAEESRVKKEISINESIRKKERENIKQRRLDIENKKRKGKGLELLTKLDEEDVEEKPASEETDAKKDEDDPLLDEATKVMADFIQLTTGGDAAVAQTSLKKKVLH